MGGDRQVEGDRTVFSNLLGRLTAMDGATIKGVIDRLTRRGFTSTKPDPADGRRLLVELTGQGDAVYERAKSIAKDITTKTLAPLSPDERTDLLSLLSKMT